NPTANAPAAPILRYPNGVQWAYPYMLVYWENGDPNPVDSYIIELQTFDLFTRLLSGWSAVATFPYSGSGLQAWTQVVSLGKTYEYRVRAVRNSVQSAPASPQSASACLATAPTAPTNVSGVGMSSSQIQLSWNPSSDTSFCGFQGYNIFLVTNTG